MGILQPHYRLLFAAKKEPDHDASHNLEVHITFVMGSAP